MRRSKVPATIEAKQWSRGHHHRKISFCKRRRSRGVLLVVRKPGLRLQRGELERHQNTLRFSIAEGRRFVPVETTMRSTPSAR